jgi:hypothetical protein
MINISVDSFNGSLTSFYGKSHGVLRHYKKQRPFPSCDAFFPMPSQVEGLLQIQAFRTIREQQPL